MKNAEKEIHRIRIALERNEKQLVLVLTVTEERL